MAVSSRPENFFQTTSSIVEIERKQRKSSNSLGKPVKLPSKVLALEVISDYSSGLGDVVLVAEAGGLVSRVDVSTGEISRIGRGSLAPLTSLACLPSHSKNQDRYQFELFAGGWDKSITRYTLMANAGGGGEDGSDSTETTTTTTKSTTVTSQTNFKAHNDFVKCLLVMRIADNKAILISGGADGEVNVWDVSDQENTSTNDKETTSLTKRLATLKPQARGIESIILDPYSSPDLLTIFFSTSQREIFSVSIPSQIHEINTSTLTKNLAAPIIVHETSVYRLHIDNVTGDMWTASADKTAKRLLRDQSWTADNELTLNHPDFVRDIVTHPVLSLVVTACRDEEVRVWNSNTGHLLSVLSGHYEEVTGLAFFSPSPSSSFPDENRIKTKTKPKNDRIILLSSSIDATVRQWELNAQGSVVDDTDKNSHRDGDGTTVDRTTGVKGGSDQNTTATAIITNKTETENHMDLDLGLTEEEEAELKAMMEDDDDDDN